MAIKVQNQYLGGGIQRYQGHEHHQAGKKCADVELPFCTDVPQSHSESQPAAQPDQQQRGGFHNHIRKGSPTAKGGVEEELEGLERIATDQCQDDATDQECHHYSSQRGDKGQPFWYFLSAFFNMQMKWQPHGLLLMAPVIISPMLFKSASLGLNSPTSSPS